MPPILREQQELNNQLQQAGFDFAIPDIRLAWRVFTEFMQITLPNSTISQIGFECLHVGDRDDILWLQFVCDVERDDGFQQIGCFFSRKVPEEMAIVSKNLWWSPLQEATAREQSDKWDLMTFFITVESLPEFGKCLSLDGWNWHM